LLTPISPVLGSRLGTSIQICANLNHREKLKAVLIELIPRELTENLVLV